MNDSGEKVLNQSRKNATLCPVCNCTLNTENKSKHLLNVHLMGIKAYLTDALKCLETLKGDMCECVLCHKSIKKTKLVSHFNKEHKYLFRFDDLKSGTNRIGTEISSQKPEYAKSVEYCECGRRIGFREIGPNLIKAYNIDAHKKYTDAHICDGDIKSQSIYAYNAGMVDSSRKRH